jgi:YD repeat-containing protein
VGTDGVETLWRYGSDYIETVVNQARTSISRFNAAGQVTSVEGPEGTVTYTRDTLGQVTDTDSPGPARVHLTYDLFGRKASMDDPNMGHWEYSYSAFGELISQKDAKLQVTTFECDQLGRLWHKTSPDTETTWTFDQAANGLGRLASLNHRDLVSQSVLSTESYTYDALSRGKTVTKTILGASYTYTSDYDTFSRPSTLIYPGRFKTRQGYSPRGYLTSVADAVTARLFWQGNSFDASGKVTSETFGNRLTTTSTFYPTTGRPDTIVTSGGIQNGKYTFDVYGNLKTRQDLRQAQQETFAYDDASRLVGVQRNGGALAEHTYNANGNLEWKAGTGWLEYTGAGAGPHAIKRRYNVNSQLVATYTTTRTATCWGPATA